MRHDELQKNVAARLEQIQQKGPACSRRFADRGQESAESVQHEFQPARRTVAATQSPGGPCRFLQVQARKTRSSARGNFAGGGGLDREEAFVVQNAQRPRTPAPASATRGFWPNHQKVTRSTCAARPTWQERWSCSLCSSGLLKGAAHREGASAPMAGGASDFEESTKTVEAPRKDTVRSRPLGGPAGAMRVQKEEWQQKSARHGARVRREEREHQSRVNGENDR